MIGMEDSEGLEVSKDLFEEMNIIWELQGDNMFLIGDQLKIMKDLVGIVGDLEEVVIEGKIKNIE